MTKLVWVLTLLVAVRLFAYGERRIGIVHVHVITALRVVRVEFLSHFFLFCFVRIRFAASSVRSEICHHDRYLHVMLLLGLVPPWTTFFPSSHALNLLRLHVFNYEIDQLAFSGPGRA